jgi:hypothetical protein
MREYFAGPSLNAWDNVGMQICSQISDTEPEIECDFQEPAGPDHVVILFDSMLHVHAAKSILEDDGWIVRYLPPNTALRVIGKR